MNERIQQMIYNLNEKVGVHWTNKDKLKFAELIVQECVNVLYYENGIWGSRTSDTLNKHFGVKNED